MKIGILTLPFGTNYGGILQAWALKTILEGYGHEIVFVNTSRSDNIITKAKIFIKSRMCFFPFLVAKLPTLKKFNKSKYIRSFINNELCFVFITGKVRLLDILVVGSDQVWRKWGKTWNIKPYFLDFAQNWEIKRYAYAVSLGIDKWDFSEKETEIIKVLLEKFDRITVREIDAKNILQEKFNIHSEWVLDPTMLLSKEEYINRLNIKKEKTITLAAYILDHEEEKNRILNTVSSNWGYTIHKIGNLITDRKGRECFPSVEHWIEDFVMSENIITDSFHGTAFAINFNKNFVVLCNRYRGQSRLTSILSLFGLEDRLVTNENDAIKLLLTPIDWKRVNHIISVEREKAMNFLKQL